MVVRAPQSLCCWKAASYRTVWERKGRDLQTRTKEFPHHHHHDLPICTRAPYGEKKNLLIQVIGCLASVLWFLLLLLLTAPRTNPTMQASKHMWNHLAAERDLKLWLQQCISCKLNRKKQRDFAAAYLEWEQTGAYTQMHTQESRASLQGPTLLHWGAPDAAALVKISTLLWAVIWKGDLGCCMWDKW